MTDINKQIEEALRSKIKNFKNSTTIFDTRNYVLIDDAIGIVSSFIDSSRWRKVSEELPPMETQVLVKTSNGKFSISEMYIPKDCNGNILGDKEWKGSFSFKCSIIEWKPID